MVTPLPDKFKWIKIGIGFGLRYYVNLYAVMEVYYNEENIRCYRYLYILNSDYSTGFHFVGRLYAIDSSKYELFASYRLKTSFDSGIEMDNALLSLCFGVKF